MKDACSLIGSSNPTATQLTLRVRRSTLSVNPNVEIMRYGQTILTGRTRTRLDKKSSQYPRTELAITRYRNQLVR